MEIMKYYGSDEKEREFINNDSEPLMAVIKYDGSQVIVSLLDEGFEHHILLSKSIDSFEIDKYFRIIFDNEGCDWTFVCPTDYKNMTNKQKRIETFYKDGINAITEFLKEIGYNNIPINIPRRYRRHMDYMNNNEYLDIKKQKRNSDIHTIRVS